MTGRSVLALAAAVAVVTLVPLTAAAKTLVEGRPEFKEGRELGYYVWADGDTWHIRWTTTGALRHFTGHVTADGGELKSLKRVDVEQERKIVRGGRAPHVVRGPHGRVRTVAPGRAPVVVSRDQDRVELDGERRIRFNAKTDDDIDGFDFKVSDGARSLRFVLEIGGKSRVADVEAGRHNRQPGGNPFVVQLR